VSTVYLVCFGWRKVLNRTTKSGAARVHIDERVSCGTSVEVDLHPPKRCPPPVLIRRSPDRAAPNPGRREQSHRVAGTATLRSSPWRPAGFDPSGGPQAALGLFHDPGNGGDNSSGGTLEQGKQLGSNILCAPETGRRSRTGAGCPRLEFRGAGMPARWLSSPASAWQWPAPRPPATVTDA
jgi:hypothetical protein